MRLKHTLILLTMVSVVADTLLLPFYPQFFAEAFGETSAAHVGAYIAACCFTVMTAFPLWARLARKIDEVHLWIYTQIAAGCLGLYCAQTQSLLGFWIASQLMLVFKASYLLIYPYVLRLEEKDNHLNVAGLFSVMVHFGAIGGALVGGSLLQYFAAQSVYYFMAASDAVQVALCIGLVLTLKTPLRKTVTPVQDAAGGESGFLFGLSPLVLKISFVSALFYFSSFMARPYFSVYWEGVSGVEQKMLSALVYSIPAWVALACLWMGRNANGPQNHVQKIQWGALAAIVGLVLQASESMVLIVLGRCLFGYGLYQIMVRLEVILFEKSTPDDYAADFSKVHFFQNVGVIGASFSVGYIVDALGVLHTFTASVVGFCLALVCFYLLFKPRVETTSASGNNATMTLSGVSND
ncbi:MFS transporter [Simiduia agarivorans]|uniref:Major facilitator superfamily transporter n=1 Tax=Simiduia agarivorans (strain DSM 21679 / JCM 13881 / BCRC 17597 / SA1) TaxID=1117647 RepID=K4KJT2_SIMAS|nr:MFS transporter [Simiduia agarivorans]AFU98485.1 major facilitator superfamily transporter [Simiduia agarivorans SA1 = DSM 21679]